MNMQSIHAPAAPATIGAYSQAISWDSLVFLSGQIPLDPQTMQLVSTDISTQIKQVLTNLDAVCAAAGGNLAHIVKLTVYLLDLSHAAQLNEIMRSYFTTPYPARTMIGVQALPRDAMIEIDAIMALTCAHSTHPTT